MLKRNHFFLLLLSLVTQIHLNAAQMNVEVKEQEEDQMTVEMQILAQETLKIIDKPVTSEENQTEKNKELQNLYQQHPKLCEEVKAAMQMFKIIWETNWLNRTEQAARLQNLLQQYPRIINQRLHGDDTALIHSIRHNVDEIAQILIDAGANLNLRNKDGNTALIMAVREENKNIVQLLIAAGANKEMRDNYDDTALDNAISKRFGDEYLAAVAAGEKERHRYEQAQQVAKKELEQHMIPELAKITAEYAYNPQVHEDLPKSPEIKQSWWDKAKGLASKLSRGNK